MNYKRLELVALKVEHAIKERPDSEVAKDLFWLSNQLRESISVLRQIVEAIPQKRDWLDPVLEQRAKALMDNTTT